MGQFLAAASVVLSLVFVGYEIRQNTAVARSEAYYSFASGFTEYNLVTATDDQLAPPLVRVNAGALPEEFDAEARLRLDAAYLGLLRLWEGLFQSVQEGILEADALDPVARGRAFDNQYFRKLWPTWSTMFHPEFTEFFETLDWNRGA